MGTTVHVRADEARHDKGSDLAARMLRLNKDLPKARTEHEKTTRNQKDRRQTADG
jgi:hypothetical protein